MNNTEQPPAPTTIGWAQLRRLNVHRTSGPTDDTVRKLRDEISIAFGSKHGTKVSADAVFFASMNIAARDMKRLIDEVRAVMTDQYAPPLPHDPGE